MPGSISSARQEDLALMKSKIRSSVGTMVPITPSLKLQYKSNKHVLG